MRLFIFTIIFSIAHLSYSQKLSSLKPDTKQSLLNDRGFLMFPSIAKNLQRNAGIMSADPNQNEETRIMFDEGDGRFVFFAQEMFALGDKNDLSTLKEKFSSLKATVTVLSKTDPTTYLITPTEFDSKQEAILVKALIVQAADGTLFQVSAYVNPAGFARKDEFQALCDEIFKTYQPGTRKINLKAHQEKLKIMGSTKSFEFSLPDNYAVTMDQKYDFQVFKIHKFEKLSSENWLNCIVYLGHHPSLVHPDFGLTPKDSKGVAVSFLGQKSDWWYFQIKERNIYLLEQLVDAQVIEKDLEAHIALMSGDSESINQLQKIIEQVKIVN